MTHFYTMSFFVNPTIKTIIISFPFDIQFTTFSFKYFFYAKFLLISLLQFFFIKTFSNFFTIQIINNISQKNCIFNFTNNKNFFWPNWSISFSKNVFMFWNSNMITNFKFRIFFIWIFIVFSIRIVRNINRFQFYCSMNCELELWTCCIVFINNIINLSK